MVLSQVFVRIDGDWMTIPRAKIFTPTHRFALTNR